MTPTTPTRKRPRIALVVVGLLAATLALTSAAVGAAALWAEGQKDADGFVSADSHRYSSGTNALVSGNLDLDGASWLVDEDQYGNVRLEVQSDAPEPVFVGIARTDDVEEYLADVPYSTVTDVEFGSLDASYENHAGDRRPSPPGNETFWDKSASGVGEQAIEWNVQDGDWSIVVMNADGSAGVDADVSAGARFPWLDDIGWTALGIAGFMSIGAALLLVAGFRGPRRPSATPAPTATPAIV